MGAYELRPWAVAVLTLRLNLRINLQSLAAWSCIAILKVYNQKIGACANGPENELVIQAHPPDYYLILGNNLSDL